MLSVVQMAVPRRYSMVLFFSFWENAILRLWHDGFHKVVAVSIADVEVMEVRL